MLMPAEHQPTDETRRFVLVGVSRVSSRRLHGVRGLKTSYGSSAVVFFVLGGGGGREICLVLHSFVASVGVRGYCRPLKTCKNWTPQTSRRNARC